MVAFIAGAVLTAANLNSAFNALTIRTVTGTSDTLVLADNGGAVTYSNASPVAVTVPLFSSIAYATGTKIVLVNLGAGTVTVAGAGGVTVNGSPLTLAQNAGGTLLKTNTNTWSFLPFSSGVGGGMDLITPTSVAGSGVTLSGGQVTFTAATTISVNGCFNSAYANYKVIFEGVASGADVNRMRLRASGSDASGADYNYEVLGGNSTSVAAQDYASQTAFEYWSVANTVSMVSEVLIRRPNLAQTTMISAQGGRNNYAAIMNGYHNTTTQYDGFSVFTYTYNMTGTLRVYGLRNS